MDNQELLRVNERLDKLERDNEYYRVGYPINPLVQRIIRDSVLIPVSVSLTGTTATLPANYGVFFTADKAYTVVGFAGSYGTAATAGTVQIEKLTGTTILDSGTTVLLRGFDVTQNVNTAKSYFVDLVTSDAISLQKGDRLALKDIGALTNLAGLNITTYLQQT